WGEPNKSYKIQIVEYDSISQEIVNYSDIINVAEYGEFSKNFDDAQIYIYTQKYEHNNRANAFVVIDLQQPASNHFIGIKIFSPENCAVNGWCEDAGFSSKSISGWSDGNSNSTVGEIGGTGKRTISVGAYTSKSVFTNYINNQVYNFSGFMSTGALAYFSSRGPTLDGRIKPDVVAPGQMIVSSYQSTSAVIGDRNNFPVAEKNVGGKSYYFGASQGTSMSSPFAAGVIALWLQMKHDLTPEDIREIIAKTSIKDSKTGEISTDGSNIWGFGKINAVEGLRYIAKKYDIKQPKIKPYFFNDGTLKIFFPKAVENITVDLYTFDGKKIYSKLLGNTFTMNEKSIYISLPKGFYFGLIYYTENGENKVSGGKIMF
ncbi:MAG: S8 family serine peptidase, partial [Prevotellaceae bacterium]|nr:S8 family serine peptidase [Prevotellaceae bacterium]